MLNAAQVFGVSGGVSASAAVLVILRSGLSRNVKIMSASAVAACALAFGLSSYRLLQSRTADTEPPATEAPAPDTEPEALEPISIAPFSGEENDDAEEQKTSVRNATDPKKT